jgi:hypothetical protein
MNKAVETCQRNELWALLKKIDAHYGGNDIEWLKIYAKDILQHHSLEAALTCFRDIAKQVPDKIMTQISKSELNRIHKRELQKPFIENL